MFTVKFEYSKGYLLGKLFRTSLRTRAPFLIILAAFVAAETVSLIIRGRFFILGWPDIAVWAVLLVPLVSRFRKGLRQALMLAGMSAECKFGDDALTVVFNVSGHTESHGRAYSAWRRAEKSGELILTMERVVLSIPASALDGEQRAFIESRIAPAPKVPFSLKGLINE